MKAAVALLALAATCAHADPLEVQAEAGQCRLGVERDGVFWQADKPTENYMHPACWSIALARKFGDTLGWRVAFGEVSSFQARGNIATTDAAQHQQGTCDRNTGDFCRYRFDGAGSLKTLSAALTAGYPLGGHWHLVGEAGFMLTKGTISVRIAPLDHEGPVRSGELHSRWLDVPAPLVGITLRYRSVYATLRHAWPAEHKELNLTNYGQDQLVMGVAF